MKGKVFHFNRARGWGIIVGDDGKFYYFHHSWLKSFREKNGWKYLKKNDPVSFVDKGKEALEVIYEA